MRKPSANTAIAGAFLAAWWVAYPVFTFPYGTSENVEVDVIQQPFLEGENLVYRWTGDIVRSCEVHLSRAIIDSENVVTNLTSKQFAAMPRSALGHQSYEVTVPVPVRIAPGPAVYQAIETPSCTWLQRLFPRAIKYPPVHFIVTR